ncbi:hypothetical protein D6825_02035 [Candidatus Woesearchaeota archaeon]|nr:MAG: hypothetical protein D6825_02035 [Candidatus Woesearchaeota archaeon]
MKKGMVHWEVFSIFAVVSFGLLFLGLMSQMRVSPQLTGYAQISVYEDKSSCYDGGCGLPEESEGGLWKALAVAITALAVLVISFIVTRLPRSRKSQSVPKDFGHLDKILEEVEKSSASVRKR